MGAIIDMIWHCGIEASVVEEGLGLALQTLVKQLSFDGNGILVSTGEATLDSMRGLAPGSDTRRASVCTHNSLHTHAMNAMPLPPWFPPCHWPGMGVRVGQATGASQHIALDRPMSMCRHKPNFRMPTGWVGGWAGVFVFAEPCNDAALPILPMLPILPIVPRLQILQMLYLNALAMLQIALI